MSGWLRSNRFWLPAVPLAFLAMLAGSSYHLKTFWYDNGLHHVIARAEPGRSVYVVDPYDDAQGHTAHRFRVRLDGLTRVTQVTDSSGDRVDLPAGADAYQVDLSFRAAPSMALSYCNVALVDVDGNRFGGDQSDPVRQSNKCVPEGHEGPTAALFKGQLRGAVPPGAERPPSWSVAPVVLVRHGAHIRAAWLWFDRPDYVVLPLAR